MIISYSNYFLFGITPRLHCPAPNFQAGTQSGSSVPGCPSAPEGTSMYSQSFFHRTHYSTACLTTTPVCVVPTLTGCPTCIWFIYFYLYIPPQYSHTNLFYLLFILFSGKLSSELLLDLPAVAANVIQKLFVFNLKQSFRTNGGR